MLYTLIKHYVYKCLVYTLHFLIYDGPCRTSETSESFAQFHIYSSGNATWLCALTFMANTYNAYLIFSIVFKHSNTLNVTFLNSIYNACYKFPCLLAYRDETRRTCPRVCVCGGGGQFCSGGGALKCTDILEFQERP